jgi:hypothetical protein
MEQELAQESSNNNSTAYRIPHIGGYCASNYFERNKLKQKYTTE